MSAVGRYTFNTNERCDPAATPSDIRTAVAQKKADDEAKVAELVSKGTPAVRVQYADGGQHQSFRNTSLAYAAGAGSESPIATLQSTRLARLSPRCRGPTRLMPSRRLRWVPTASR